MHPRTRARLARLHRWTALALTPVYIAVLLSGAVLAVRPFTHGRPRQALAAPVDVDRLGARVTRLERAGPIDYVNVDTDGHTAGVGRGGSAKSYDLRTGLEVAAAPATPPDLYEIARRIHVRLWIGAGSLVTAATFAMLFLVVAGPILSRPRRPRAALGWHIAAGWVLWPLLVFLPLTAAMMVLPIGRSIGPRRIGSPISLGRALAVARPRLDLTRIHLLRPMGDGKAYVVTEGRFGVTRWIVREDGVERIGGPAVELARMVHEGEWAGPWSGALNLTGALGLIALMGTGCLSWWRRRARSSRRTPRRSHRVAVPAGYSLGTQRDVDGVGAPDRQLL